MRILKCRVGSGIARPTIRLCDIHNAVLRQIGKKYYVIAQAWNPAARASNSYRQLLIGAGTEAGGATGSCSAWRFRYSSTALRTIAPRDRTGRSWMRCSSRARVVEGFNRTKT